MLAVIETHPVQYHAPVYRAVEQSLGIPVTAIYASDFSLAGSVDPEFGAAVSWDVDLLGGYSHRFLSAVANGGARNTGEASVRGLGGVLDALRPGAILLLGYSPRFHQLAFLAARKARCPLLFRGETTDHARVRGAIARSLRDVALRAYYRSFARLLFVGERSRAHFERLRIAPDRLVFSPYCVDVAPFDPSEERRDALRASARSELALPADAAVLLFSGKLSERKGVDVLLDAVKSMPPPRPAIVFLGEGERRGALAARAGADPRVEVRFPGFRNQSQLSRYYHAADLLALPSVRSETWGLVVNEALHHGVPCVVTEAVGCAPDLVVPGTTGEICAAGSAAALRAAIERSLPLAGKSDVRAACRERVSGYSVAAAAAGIARAYREAVGA
jgi:glycosyltransferase involved in cell wall biosynthesis